MTQINSPYLLSKIRPAGEFSRATNNYLTQLERSLQQIYARVGGSNDAVSEATNGELFDPGIQVFDIEDISSLKVDESLSQLTHDLLERVEELESISFSLGVEVKSLETYALNPGDTTLTTTGDQWVPCLNTASATVTLNLTPNDGEDVIVWRGGPPVTVLGAINGGASIVIKNRYDAPHFKYSLDAEEWAIV